MVIINYINKYYKGGAIKSSFPLVGVYPAKSRKPQNLALLVTIVTVVPTMLLIVTVFLLLQLLP